MGSVVVEPVFLALFAFFGESFSMDDANKPGYWSTDLLKWKKLGGAARENRKNPTEAEKAFWEIVRNRRLGVRFRRQHVIDRFIADFVCLEKNLIVEIDGSVHEDTREYDADRTEVLAGFGFRVIRFSNDTVLSDAQSVREELLDALGSRT